MVQSSIPCSISDSQWNNDVYFLILDAQALKFMARNLNPDLQDGNRKLANSIIKIIYE